MSRDGRPRWAYQPTSDFVLPQMIRARAEARPDEPLLQVVGDATRDETASRFHERAMVLADALDGAGVEPGHTVAVMLDHSPESLRSWISVAWLRAWEVAVNPEFRAASLVHSLNDSQARVLITQDSYLDRVAAVADQLPYLTRVVVVDGADGPNHLATGVVVESMRHFVADARPRERAGPRESDPYAIVYTSGTTGPSKGVLTPWGMAHEAWSCLCPDDDFEEYDDPAVYSPWPTFHASGKFGLVLAVEGGQRLVQRGKFSLSHFWSDVRDHRCSHTLLVSIGAVLWNERQEADRDNPLKRAFMLPLIPQFRQFEEFFRMRLTTGWGMTEVGLPVIAKHPTPGGKACGVRNDRYQVRIVDEDDQPVPVGEVGQLVVRHDEPWKLALGYFHRPEASLAAWRNGWFHTGDGLREDADGNFYFVDRIKDYIRFRGHNVSSLEVEAEVLSHPDVAECACVGVASDFGHARGAVAAQADTAVLGDEDIRVFVVPAAGRTDLTAAGLSAYLADRMPPFMLPRYVDLLDELPKTPTEKVQKAALRSRPIEPTTWDRGADRSRQKEMQS